MTDASQSENLSGKQLGGYEFLNVIGYGGMATVYRARQLSMQRIVALKVLPRQFMQDDTYMQRFHREVEIVSRLEHRNIVPVHDYGEFDGQPYIVMRYMPAGSVDDLLRNGPLDFELTEKIIEQIAPALDYAHTKGVLHRDLKPSNILMDDNGDAYLTDFGIARVLGENSGGISITTKHVVGTPAYMSPEQAQGQSLDNRSDIYSLGITLFEMATGQRPFVAETPYGVAVLQVTTPAPAPRSFNPNIPIPLEKVIERTLRKKPDERYNSALMLSEAVRSALDPDAASVHDTMVGIAKPTKPVEVRQRAAYAAPAVPITPPPPARYPTPRTPRSSRAVPAVRPGRMFRPRQRPNNLWMSAAIGGIIGCGLLTLLVILLALMLNGSPTAANTNRQSRDSNQNAPSNLDPTSEAARRALLGYEAEE
jgi:tRNA A-37 threonylcarbamoyl transferase component Bud32